MGHHWWHWSHVLSNKCNQACRVLRGKCHGTWPGANEWSLPVLVAKIPSHSSLTSWTASPSFVLWSVSESGRLGPHLMCLSCQATPATQALNWQLPPLPLESSSSESDSKPYYSSPQWWHSYCHCTSWCRHSVSSYLEAMTSLCSVGSSTLVATLPSSNVAVTCWTAKR